jgi:uncharacterized membrane protein YebE (DUF533 family)
MDKRWVVKEKGDASVVKQLAGALGVSDSLANRLEKQMHFLIQASIICMIRF